MKKILIIIILFLFSFTARAQKWEIEYANDELCVFYNSEEVFIVYETTSNTTFFVFKGRYNDLKYIESETDRISSMKVYYLSNNAAIKTKTKPLYLMDTENYIWGLNSLNSKKNEDIEWLTSNNQTIVYQFILSNGESFLISVKDLIQ